MPNIYLLNSTRNVGL